MMRKARLFIFCLALLTCPVVAAQTGDTRTLNLSIDNLTNKHYYETQNFFASRLTPGGAEASRIHGTPGYPLGVTIGLTFHLFGKD